MKCKVCDREVEAEGFCSSHLKAYVNLKGTFEVWRRALDISWKAYLSQIVVNASTGDWVKTVAIYLKENGET